MVGTDYLAPQLIDAVARWFLILLVCLALDLTVLAREGFVRTRTGRVLEGRIRFERDVVVVVDSERDFLERVPLTNIWSVNFEVTSAHTLPFGSSSTGGRGSWSNMDVGSVIEAGCADFRPEGIRIRTSGTNLFGSSDSFHFVYRRAAGDSHLVCRVADIENSHPLTQVGLIIREGLSAEARQVSFMLTARRGAMLGRRQGFGTDPEIVANRPMRAPQWLKLSRFGDVFTGYYSRDGRRWFLMGRTRVEMSEDVFVGAGAVGFREGVLASARVERLQESKISENGFVPEMRLTGGSIEISRIESMDDSLIQLGGGGGALNTKAVASIRFRPVPQRLGKMIASGRTGIVLASGEFVAGDIRGIKSGHVILSSVPLGLRNYDIETEVMAVILRKPGVSAQAPCRLTTVEGSVWLASSMKIDGDWVLLKDNFGIWRVPLYRVVELEWRGKASA